MQAYGVYPPNREELSFIDHNKKGFGADEFTWLGEDSFSGDDPREKLHFKLVYREKNLELHGKVRTLSDKFDVFNNHPWHKELDWLVCLNECYPHHPNFPTLIKGYRAVPANCEALTFLPMRALCSSVGPYVSIIITPEYSPASDFTLVDLKSIFDALSVLKTDFGFMHNDLHDGNILRDKNSGTPIIWDFELSVAHNLSKAKAKYAILADKSEIGMSPELPQEFLAGYDEQLCIISLAKENAEIALFAKSIKAYPTFEETSSQEQTHKRKKEGDTEGENIDETDEEDDSSDEDEEDDEETDYAKNILYTLMGLSQIGKPTATLCRKLAKKAAELQCIYSLEALLDSYCDIMGEEAEADQKRIQQLVEQSHRREWYYASTDTFATLARPIRETNREFCAQQAEKEQKRCLERIFDCTKMDEIGRLQSARFKSTLLPGAKDLVEIISAFMARGGSALV